MSCIEVAVACGFQSSTTFSNAYYRRFGRRPAKEFQGSGGMDKSPTPAPLSLPFRETVIRDGDLCEKAAA
jgi:AraC-like DNA-binding protein